MSAVVEANLERVFNERDAGARRRAIEELYTADAVMYEVEAVYTGPDAIADAVTHLLGVLPPALRFTPVAAALVNHGMQMLRWRGELPDGTVIATGTDVVQVENGRIRSIHVFLDPG